MLVVDTNILLYAVNSDTPEHRRCRAFLGERRLSPLPWYLTWSIVYEFLRVATHRRVLPRPLSVEQGWQFIAALLAAPGLSVLVPTSRHVPLAAETFAEHPELCGNLLHGVKITV